MSAPVDHPAPVALPLTAVSRPQEAFTRSMYRLRLERGWSQNRLATEAGVGNNCIARMEAGPCGCTLETAWRIAEALETDPTAMILGEAR